MLRKVLKNNRGAAMVIYAFMFVAMLGMTAVAVDTGNVVIQKQKFQKAVDAAALAAAQYLPDTSAAANAANQYVEKNGFSREDIDVSFADSGKTIVIEATKHIDYTFARILGLDGTDVTLGAKAASGTMGGPFNYVLFSGSTSSTLTLNGSSYYVQGSSHTNRNFLANGSSSTITGRCEAVGTITVNGSNMHIDHRFPGSAHIAMPDFSETIRLQAAAAGQIYEGNKTFNGSSIDVSDPLYVEGNITINGSKFTGTGFLFATGNITFNGSSMRMSSGDSVCIYSKNGYIRINGSNAEVDGILYAPNGSVTMNGSHQTVRGRVIGYTVTLNGSQIEVIGSDGDLDCLPSTFVKLIK